MRGVVGWGYEGKCLDDLVEFVNEVGAVAVVDVRMHAMSRKADFRKRAIAERLDRAGVAYEHLPELGNPKDNREAFASPGTAAAARAHERFVAEVVETDDARRALDAVRQRAESGTVVLVCYEHEDERCHRSLVMDALEPALATT